MKSKVAMMCLAFASASFAVDEYLPVAPGKTEIDVGVAYVTPEVSDASLGVPLQVKYGVAPNLDIEVAATYSLSGGVTGLTAPEVAAKYAIGASGLAAYVNVGLPFAVGDYADGYLGITVQPGVVYNKNYDKIVGVARAYYQINMEDDGFTPGNVLGVLVKPGYMIDDKLAPYVGVDFKMVGEGEAGPFTIDGGNTFTLLPGLNYTISDKLALEANVPLVLSNDVGETSWGIWASLYITL
jgi:hypothetical protein